MAKKFIFPAIRKYRRKKPIEAKIVESKKPAPKKTLKEYLPPLRVMQNIIKDAVPLTEGYPYSGRDEESDALEEKAMERKEKLIATDKEYNALIRKAEAIKKANKAKNDKALALRKDLFNRLNLKGVTPALVDRVYRLLELDKKE